MRARVEYGSDICRPGLYKNKWGTPTTKLEPKYSS